LEKKRRMVELGVESLHMKRDAVSAELAHARRELEIHQAATMKTQESVRALEVDLEVIEELIAETTKRLQHIQSPLAEVVPQGQVVISRPNPAVVREPSEDLLRRAIEWARGREWFRLLKMSEALVANHDTFRTSIFVKWMTAGHFEHNGGKTAQSRYKLAARHAIPQVESLVERGERNREAREAGLLK
jgi:hypothetical protein